MDLRLRNLENLDARAVPLPHGTEVITGVDRTLGDRRVPQGTIGRVAKSDGDVVDVTVVGIGVRFLEKEPTTKKLLYVLRTTLTGIHLLETGELEPDVTQLAGLYGLPDAMTLVERKRTGERIGIDSKLLETWRPRVDALFVRLDAAHDKSRLPDAPPNEPEVRDWLLAVRRARM